MLEIKNLTKTYKAKGGVVTKALDNVSVKFPDKGMVFLLGKSGSGKSTLLNVSGGLDKPDSGEIIIKGRNSKDFSGADFDSYRNTYIGFIFQEYNILDEFNIEQNISLALQLQGKPNDKTAVEAMLEQVDLKGFGKRKPNTLSGGQKQRIAIARALIKNPEIIMADEPTGALDSKTGKQVFDTLKKLSKDKLVIVVSHDRDFAEIYGDRIIELSDGKIISDVSKETVDSKPISGNVQIVNENTISINDSSILSEADVKDIYKILKSKKGEVVISSGTHDVPLVKQAIHVRDDNKSEVFNDTKEVPVSKYDPKDTKFIRSRLPMARAFKMGSSSLKTKPFRLIITLLLTTTALTMFGITSTLLLYDSSYAISTALESSPNDYESIIKKYRYKSESGTIDLETMEVENSYNNESSDITEFGVEEIKNLNSNSVGHRFAGVFGMRYNSWSDDNPLTFQTISGSGNYYFQTSFFGFCDAGESYMNENGFSLLAGAYPTDSKSIAISNYMYEVIKESEATVNTYSDVVGKKYSFMLRTSYGGGYGVEFTISGIYNVGEIPAEFSNLKTQDDKNLKSRLESYLSKSYHLLAYVNDTFYEDNNFHADGGSSHSPNTAWIKGVQWSTDPNVTATVDSQISIYPADAISPAQSFTFVNKNKEAIAYVEPGDNEVYLPASILTYAELSKMSDFLNVASHISEYRNFVEDLRTSTYDNIEEKINIVRNGFNNKMYGGNPGENYEESLSFLKALVRDYFSKVDTNYYKFKKASHYINQHERDDISWSSDANYVAFRDLYYQLQDDNSQITDARLNTLNDYMSAHDGENVVMHGEVYYVAQQVYYGYDFNKGDTYWSSISSSIEAIYNTNGVYSASLDADYEAILNKAKSLDEYYTFGIKFEYASDYVAPNYVEKEVEELHCYYKKSNGTGGELTIIGYYSSGDYYSDGLLTTVANAKKLGNFEYSSYYYEKLQTDYERPIDAKYQYVITKTDFNQNQIKNLMQDNDSYFYDLTNQAYLSVSWIIDLIGSLKQIFFWIGVVFAVFAALMLFNFISTSISSKMKEIGILRAVGARGSDLFKIFFSESGIIAAICFVIATIGSAITCWRLNAMFKERIITITSDVGFSLLNFGIINILLIVVGSLLIAFIGTFFPVLRASKKAPVDSIRTL